MVKQVIVVRKDLGISKGQMIAMGAHASMAIFTNRMKDSGWSDGRLSIGPDDDWDWFDAVLPWLTGQFTKVVLGIKGGPELRAIYDAAREDGVVCSLIDDENIGVAAVALGPDKAERIDPITGHLRLL